MQDLGNKLAGCHVFSRLDLVKGYHQVPVADAYVPKIAIITLFGLYKYLYIPFGLKNAAQSFQQLMDNLLAEVPHIFIYLDDILIGTPDLASHLVVLRQVFGILDANGLTINFGKCDFLQDDITFLGHGVSAAGVTLLGGHVSALTSVSRPTTPKELQRFLGVFNYYRRFLPAVALTLQPLTEALKGNPKVLVWTPRCHSWLSRTPWWRWCRWHTCCPTRSCRWPPMYPTPTLGAFCSSDRLAATWLLLQEVVHYRVF